LLQFFCGSRGAPSETTRHTGYERFQSMMAPRRLGHDFEKQANRLQLRITIKLFFCRSVHDLLRKSPLPHPFVVLAHQWEISTTVTIVMLQCRNEWAVRVVSAAY
jgi:hypothetical protein